MRILLCATSPPVPPMDGYRLLLHRLLRGLREQHDVRLVAGCRSDQRPEDAAALPDVVLAPAISDGRLRSLASLPAALLRRRPLSDHRIAARLWPTIARELASFRPDVVHVVSGRLAVLGARLSAWPTVLGAIDARHLNVEAKAAEASGWTRLALRDEARRVRRLMATEYRRFDQVTVVTDADRAAHLAIDPSLEVTAIPNGVDTDHFAPSSRSAVAPNRLIFTGTMSYAPNVTAARVLAKEVLPIVRARLPSARLVLAGRDPAPVVSALGHLDGVTVTGEVPDVRSWLTGSHVFVAPMSTGTGIKNKVLEAMACGLPCVLSPLATQGTNISDGAEALIEAEPTAMASAIVQVLEDPDLAARLGKAGRAYVVRHHGWDTVVARHVEVYERAISRVATMSMGGAR